MGNKVGVSMVTLMDLNDAIIAGEAPLNPTEGTLWIDSSLTPPVLKKWSMGAWVTQAMSLEELDPEFTEYISQGVDQATTKLGNLSSDDRITATERQVILDKLTDMLGASPSGTVPLPAVATVNTYTAGEYYQTRKSATDAGVGTSDTAYTAYANAYTTLANYLNTILADGIYCWDVSNAKVETVHTIVGQTFRDNWKAFYQAQLVLQTRTSKRVSDAKAEAEAYANSYREQLVGNGFAGVASNRNFSGFTYTTAQKVTGPGSFSRTATGETRTDEFIAIEPDRPYRLMVSVINSTTTGTHNIGLECYNAAGTSLGKRHILRSGTNNALPSTTSFVHYEGVISGLNIGAGGVTDTDFPAGTTQVKVYFNTNIGTTTNTIYVADVSFALETIEANKDYNGISLSALKGMVVTSTKNIAEFNATDGIKVYKKTDPANPVFKLDSATGDLTVTGSINMMGGSITWANVNKPTAAQVGAATPDDVATAVDNIKVGGTNLIPNSSGEFLTLQGAPLNWGIFNASKNLQSIAGRVNGKAVRVQMNGSNGGGQGMATPSTATNAITGGETYTISFWVRTSSAMTVTHVLKFKNASGISSNPITSKNITTVANTWTRYEETFVAPSDAVELYTTPRIAGAVIADMTFDIDELKIEKGNRATDWSPAPEDINTSLSNLEIGGTNLLLDSEREQTGSTLVYYNFNGNRLAGREGKQMIISFDAKADADNVHVIDVYLRDMVNAALISGSQSPSFTLDGIYRRFSYAFTVPNNITTFPDVGIALRGNTAVSGGAANAGNYFIRKVQIEVGQNATDWSPAPEDTISKINAIQIGGTNLLWNSQFKDTYSTGNATSKNPDLYAKLWGGYNAGVPNPTTSFHAHVDATTFGYNVYEFNESDGNRQWKGISIALGTVTSGDFVFSGDFNATGLGTFTFGGLYYRKKGGTSFGFHSGQFNISIDSVNEWKRFSQAITLKDDVDLSQPISFYIYGYGFSTNSIMYMKNVQLEKGNKMTEWSPAPEDSSLKISDLYTLTTSVGGVTVIDANKIQTGTLDATKVNVTKLNASNITSGTINASIIGVTNLSASNINTGTLNASVVAVTNLNASNITTGTLNANNVTISSSTAGVTINSTGVVANNATTGVNVTMNSTTGFEIKKNGATVFTVDSLGSLYAKNLTIDGGTITWGTGSGKVSPPTASQVGAATTNDISTAIAGVNVGGANLLRNSTFLYDNWGISSVYGGVLQPDPDKPSSKIFEVNYLNASATGAPLYSPNRFYLNPKVGDTITFSLDFMCTDFPNLGPTSGLTTLRRFDAATGGSYVQSVTTPSYASYFSTQESNVWRRGSYTYTFTADTAVAGWYAFGLYVANTANKRLRFEVREIKVELGNKATDWSPAPQELVDLDQLVNGWKYPNKTTISGTSIETNTITATQIAANTITGNELAANTIAVKNLLVTDFTNLVDNGTFETDSIDTAPKGWHLAAGVQNAKVVDISGFQSTNGSVKALQINAITTGNNDCYVDNIIDVKPGDEMYVEAEARYLNASGTGYGRLGFQLYDGKKIMTGSWQEVIAWTPKSTTFGTGVSTNNNVYVVPAGVYGLRVWASFAKSSETTNRFYIDNIIVRRRQNGNLIVDGAITATKISTNAITSEKIQAGEVKAINIATNAITADKIKAGEIKTGHLDVGAVTAEKIAVDAIQSKIVKVGGSVTESTTEAGKGNGSLTVYDSQDSIIFNSDESGTTIAQLAISGDLRMTGEGGRLYTDSYSERTSYTHPCWTGQKPGDENASEDGDGGDFDSGNIVVHVMGQSAIKTIEEARDGTRTRPFTSIQEAIDSIPKILDHNVIIKVFPFRYEEDIKISGFTGTGTIEVKTAIWGIRNIIDVSNDNTANTVDHWSKLYMFEDNLDTDLLTSRDKRLRDHSIANPAYGNTSWTVSNVTTTNPIGPRMIINKRKMPTANFQASDSTRWYTESTKASTTPANGEEFVAGKGYVRIDMGREYDLAGIKIWKYTGSLNRDGSGRLVGNEAGTYWRAYKEVQTWVKGSSTTGITPDYTRNSVSSFNGVNDGAGSFVSFAEYIKIWDNRWVPRDYYYETEFGHTRGAVIAGKIEIKGNSNYTVAMTNFHFDATVTTTTSCMDIYRNGAFVHISDCTYIQDPDGAFAQCKVQFSQARFDECEFVGCGTNTLEISYFSDVMIDGMRGGDLWGGVYTSIGAVVAVDGSTWSYTGDPAQDIKTSTSDKSESGKKWATSGPSTLRTGYAFRKNADMGTLFANPSTLLNQNIIDGCWNEDRELRVPPASVTYSGTISSVSSVAKDGSFTVTVLVKNSNGAGMNNASVAFSSNNPTFCKFGTGLTSTATVATDSDGKATIKVTNKNTNTSTTGGYVNVTISATVSSLLPKPLTKSVSFAGSIRRLVTKIKTFTASYSESYHTGAQVWNGNYTGRDVIQSTWGGNTFKGCWFFGTTLYKACQSYENISKVRLYVSRKSGGYSSGRKANIYYHKYTSKPSGNPTLYTPSAKSSTSDIPVNEASWVTLSADFVSLMKAGTIKGFGLINDGSYFRASGSLKVEVTYQVYETI